MDEVLVEFYSEIRQSLIIAAALPTKWDRWQGGISVGHGGKRTR